MITFKGIVVSKNNKTTAKVRVKKEFLHPRYGKLVRKSSSFLVQDDLGVKVNDHVKISQCVPVSKLKRHKIEEILWYTKKLYWKL